ncbi:uncharacterized protein LOC141610919 [Silene latifolia]|uniref:uncharacterized protein LOC141610919 n=1 Tax=Silene latifolia TaxID=37657 RepID=UPI003D77AAC4
MGISSQQLETAPCRKFTLKTEESAFSRRHNYLYPTKVYLLRPPPSLSSDHLPWIFSTSSTEDVIPCHPLTFKPHPLNLPQNFDISLLRRSTIAISLRFDKSYPVDHLLMVPTPPHLDNLSKATLFALYGGGQLRGCPHFSKAERESGTSPWVKLSPDNFDDIAVYGSRTYAVDREGYTQLIIHYKTITRLDMGRMVAYVPECYSNEFRWRKRFVDDGNLYLVVRTEEKSFRVFMLEGSCWDEVRGFEGNKVLFMARDYYFFRRASRKFLGREYKNCIVFSEAAFPQYGKDGWEFTEIDNVRRCEDDIAIFRLGDRVFAREGENSGFPKIDWSPPAWIFHASSVTADGYETYYETESEREHDDEGWDSDSTDKNDGELHSDLKDLNNKDEEEQEEMESDFGCQHHDEERVESDLDSQHQVDGKMQRDLNSQEKEDEEMIEGDASLQEEGIMPSLSTVEEEVRRTLLSMNSSNGVEGETSGKIINHSIPKASTSSTIKSCKCDSATTKFEGLDIRSDLVPTLQMIWRKHGNIIKDSILRSADMIARALESLATMVRILEDNLAQFLSDSQADYLSSTLSDLKCIHFRVYWLNSYVDKALKIHKSKSLVESLNNLGQLSSQVSERRAVLLDELAKLNDEENKLKEAMEKVSKMLPFSGQVKFDEPVGAGLALDLVGNRPIT